MMLCLCSQLVLILLPLATCFAIFFAFLVFHYDDQIKHQLGDYDK